MHKFTKLILCLILISPLAVNAKISGKEKKVGFYIKNYLETYHFRDMKIDDNVSQKAFQEFLKRVDYSKQFLMSNDVKKLQKHEFKMDDQLESAELKLLDETMPLLQARVKEADQLREKIFKKQFKFDGTEKLELDPEKREWTKNKKEWEDRWTKIYKHSVLGRYMSYLEEQKDLKEDKKKNKKSKKKDKKKVEVLTDAQMRKKSHEAISKKFKLYFSRLLKDDRVDFYEKFVNSISTIYDPHTTYFPPKKKEDFDIDISGQLEGIGAVLQEDGAYIKVVRIVPGGAAWRQKELEVDDIILLVGEGKKEPVDLVDMRVDDAVRYIRGKKGTTVSLTVKKVDGTRKTINIVRDVVQVGASYVKSSVIQMKGSKKKYGYIMLPKFYRSFNDSDGINCTDDVRDELVYLKKQKVDGIILDLRNNGGGALEDARQMTGLFIKDGPIVQTKNYTDQIDVLKDTDTSVTYDGPLIVMTNRFSASASEILAGAIKDYGRGLVVGGANSHGKGTVQAVLPVGPGALRGILQEKLGALKVTIQQFYRVNGLSTQYKGVVPDIILPDPMGYAQSREQDLDYSLPWSKVGSLKYDKWGKHNLTNIDILKQRSSFRVKESPKFKKIIDSVSFLNKRRDDTIVTLNLKALKKEAEENKKITEKLKLDEENKNILVSHFEHSLRKHENVRPADEKQWKKDFAQRKEEWIEGIRKDVLLEETLSIMTDFIGHINGTKLSSTVSSSVTKK